MVTNSLPDVEPETGLMAVGFGAAWAAIEQAARNATQRNALKIFMVSFQPQGWPPANFSLAISIMSDVRRAPAGLQREGPLSLMRQFGSSWISWRAPGMRKIEPSGLNSAGCVQTIIG